MHYRNGREVKVGDSVVGKNHDGTPISGIVAKTLPGSDACNIAIVPVPVGGVYYSHISGQFLHIDDALNVTQPEADSAS